MRETLHHSQFLYAGFLKIAIGKNVEEDCGSSRSFGNGWCKTSQASILQCYHSASEYVLEALGQLIFPLLIFHEHNVRESITRIWDIWKLWKILKEMLERNKRNIKLRDPFFELFLLFQDCLNNTRCNANSTVVRVCSDINSLIFHEIYSHLGETNLSNSINKVWSINSYWICLQT